MKITFLGAMQEVTGSKYLVEHEQTKILVDCGLYQGEAEVAKRNWEAFPIQPGSIQAIVLTHGHLDHVGYIPVLVKHGFKGKIYCSPATYALCSVLLTDSGALQESDAKRAQERGDVHHAAALYTKEDAQNSLSFFQTVDYDTQFLVGSLRIKLIQSFHILGSAFVVINDGKKTLTFSGDLGRPNQMMMPAPPHITQTNFLVMESTYGNKSHPQTDPTQQLGEIVNQIVAQRGVLIIPAFAIERTQLILYCLYQLRQKNIIPKIPIFLDSPMATAVTELFTRFANEHNLSPQMSNDIFSIATYTQSVQESKKLNNVTGPVIIIAGSGMADGGRVLYHLAHFISDANNIVAFVGFQALGTHGRDLVHGAKSINLDGHWHDVRASIKIINSFSAHADYNEILQWLSFLQTKPEKLFLTHGELQARQFLKTKIEARFGWTVIIPEHLQSFDLL